MTMHCLAGYNSFLSFEKYARANGQALKLIRWSCILYRD